MTSAVGSRCRCRARTLAGVSPVRDSTVHGRPKSSTGARSAASVSPASARSGVIQSTRSGGAASVVASRRIVAQPLQHRTHPGGVGFSRSGRGVDERALAAKVGGPHFLLERKGLPPMQREPLAHAPERLTLAAIHHSRRTAGRPVHFRGGLGRPLLPALRGARAPEIDGEGTPAPDSPVAIPGHDRRWRGGAGARNIGRPAFPPRGCSARTMRRTPARTRMARRRCRWRGPRRHRGGCSSGSCT